MSEMNLDGLTYSDAPAGELPPRMMPGDRVLVARSVKLPFELDAWLGEQADHDGVGKSEIIRRALEMFRATQSAETRQITLAEAIRALSQLPAA